MANNAYICRIRTDLGSGAFQILDLLPNASQRSLIYEPNPQTGYLPPIAENDAVTGATAANVTTSILRGLAAYLVDNVAQQLAADPADGNGLSEAIADASAAAILALRNAGSPITLAAVANALSNNGVADALADTTLTTGNSVGSLEELLKIVAGGKYIVPAGTTVNSGAAYKGSADGYFADSLAKTNEQYAIYQEFFATGALQISCGEGTLAAFASSTFSYKETTGAALVVYDENGNVLT